MNLKNGTLINYATTVRETTEYKNSGYCITCNYVSFNIKEDDVNCLCSKCNNKTMQGSSQILLSYT